jgi:hypothetical protein
VVRHWHPAHQEWGEEEKKKKRKGKHRHMSQNWSGVEAEWSWRMGAENGMATNNELSGYDM